MVGVSSLARINAFKVVLISSVVDDSIVDEAGSSVAEVDFDGSVGKVGRGSKLAVRSLSLKSRSKSLRS